MEVHGALVHGRERALPLHEAEHRSRGHVDDGDRLGAGGAQCHPPGRIVASGPHDARRCFAQLAGLDQRPGALEGCVAERLAVVLVERPLEGRREHVPVQDPRVGVVEDGCLDPPAQKRLRLAHEELVECVLARDEHREPVAPPAGSAPLLAEARHGAREADGDCAVEEADVDAELERVGRRDAEQLAGDQPPLDLAPLGGRVPRPVGGETSGRLGVEPLGREAVDQLGGLAALGEADRSQAARDELGEQPRALAERARPQLQRLVQQRRVPERDRSGRPRCGIVLDDGRLVAEE